MTEQTAATVPADEVVQGDDKVRITHPKVEGDATVSREQFEVVYEPRGWTIVEEPPTSTTTPTSVNRDETVTVRHGETGATKDVTRGELLDRLQERGWSEVPGTARAGDASTPSTASPTSPGTPGEATDIPIPPRATRPAQ